MTEVNYTPVFHHTPWVDRVDRVVASGSNGFNGRFNTIAGDFRQLSGVVTQIGEAIDESVAPPPPPPTQELIFTPVLHQVTPAGWVTLSTGAAQSPFGVGTFVGVMNLTLPERVRLLSMRVVGSVSAGIFGLTGEGTIVLFQAPVRQVLDPGTTQPQPLVQFTISAEGPFDLQQAVPGPAQVDLDDFRYFIRATMDASGVPGEMTIQAVHITVANS